MSTIIQTTDRRVAYPAVEGATPVVLDGVSLEIEEGSFVAVLGHNGCGKSTLAKHMNAILLPSGGTVYVWTASTPPTRTGSWTSAGRWGWSFRTRTTRS